MGMAPTDTVAIHREAGQAGGASRRARSGDRLPVVAGAAGGSGPVPTPPARRRRPASIWAAPSGAALCVVARPGVYRIVAALARPWEPDTPSRVVVIQLTVD